MCSPLPRIRRRVGADPIPLRARIGTNDRTLPWLQTADSISCQRSYWHRAECLSGCGRVAKLVDAEGRPSFRAACSCDAADLQGSGSIALDRTVDTCRL